MTCSLQTFTQPSLFIHMYTSSQIDNQYICFVLYYLSYHHILKIAIIVET